ncbi:mechanosensitive ion channel family protein [Piscinibacter sakaiensis]|uniref:mechanosensitive ion channel family protein n=1 Tax=Piscinibacter sakaiensis TaxID=1547922 RepID=UPI003AAA70CC
MAPPGFDIEFALQRLVGEFYRLLAALPLLLMALLLVWVGWLLARWLSRHAVFERIDSRNPFLRDLARTTVRWLVTGAAILVALQVMDATALVGAVLGTAGVLGIALGFAFKDTLENYLAGILMSLRQPFAPRDHVVIDGNEGLVISMTSRATILMTLDGNHLRLPNAMVFRSVTLNYTRNPSRRFEFDVGIGVNENLVRAQRIGVDELKRLDGVIERPPPRAYIAALGDSNVQVRFHGWVDQRSNDFLLVKSEAIRKVKLALEREGMDMPEPIYRVHLTEPRQQAPAAPATAAPAPAPSADDDIDTRALTDLQEQIDQEPPSTSERDLLDPAAPKE